MAEAPTPNTLLDTAAAARRLEVSESFLAKARMHGTRAEIPQARALGSIPPARSRSMATVMLSEFHRRTRPEGRGFRSRSRPPGS